MPGIFYQPMPRKQFLKTSLGLSAAALGIPVSIFSYARTKNAHWAFLSDTHVAGDPEEAYRGFVPYQNLQTVVPQVLAAGPEELSSTATWHDSRVRSRITSGCNNYFPPWRSSCRCT